MDGDGAAAMRYTEARMQPVTAAMLEDLNEHVVEFVPNYSGTLREPSVLPTTIPALLVNGSKGIAVGMATDIPPHNLGECIDGCIAMIDNPDISLEALCQIIPGPDFPTGGKILTSAAEIRRVYETGHGPITIQSEYCIEQEGRKTRIIVTHVPYQVNKQKIIDDIKALIEGNKLPLLTDVRDESSTDVRIVLELKTGAKPEAVMAYLFKHTDLQTRFNVNLTCIVPGAPREGSDVPVYQPRRLGLKDALDYFLKFRLQIVTRRLEYQLSQLLERIHILEGYQKLFGGVDEAIAIIRDSEDKATASQALCTRFDIDEIQAEAILQLRLYRLARLEIDKINTEHEAKTKEAAHIRKLLASESLRWRIVRDELVHVKKLYGDDRRTKFDGTDLSEAYAPENYIVQEDCFVIVTKSGLFKRQKSFSDVASIRVKENDAVAFVRYGSTRCPLILLSSLGKAYTMLVDNVPATTGHGSPIATVFKLEDGEQIIGAYIDDPRFLCPEPKSVQEKSKSLLDLMGVPQEDTPQDVRCIVAVSKMAQIIRLPLELFSAVSTANGRIYMRLNEGDSVMTTAISREAGFVSVISTNTRANVFALADVPPLKTAGKGYRAIGLDPGTVLAAACIAPTDSDGVRVQLSDRREITLSMRRLSGGERGGKGRLLIRRGTVVAVLDEQKYDIDKGPESTS